MNHNDYEQRYRRIRSHSDSMFWGTLIILVGVTWLGINLGYFDVGIWHDLFRLWPLLLIIWGINILVRRTPLQLLVYVTPLILVAAFLWVATGEPISSMEAKPWWARKSALSSRSRSTELREYNYALPLREGISRVVAEVNIGAPKALIATLPSDSTSLAEVTYVTDDAEPGIQLDVQEGTAYVKVPTANRVSVGTHAWGLERMDLHLNPSLPIDLELNVGAALVKADLREANLTSLSLNGGAASMDVSLPGVGENGYRVNVSAGTAAVKLRLPADTPVYLTSASALSATNLSRSGLVKTNGHWESPDFDPESPYARIDVSGALSSISITLET